MTYRIRYALRLWNRIHDMSLLEALRYPAPNLEDRHDPIEDADEEISVMAESMG